MEKSNSGEGARLSSQERIFETVRLLQKNHISGLTNKELARLVGTSETNICRDLAIFQKYEWIERSAMSGKWRLSPKFANIAGDIARSFREAKLRLGKDEERYATAWQ